MSLPIYQVDAFTKDLFSGNPAAVCISEKPLDESLMQNIAAEMNLSETAFVSPLEEKNTFLIRWFTPTTEVKLCGHATLASAHILFETEYVKDNEITFYNKDKSLTLITKKSPYGIALDFPVDSISEWKDKERKALLSYLGLPYTCPVYRGEVTGQILIETPQEEILVELEPNFNRLISLDGNYTGVIVTSKSSEFDFVSRFFDPWEGIDEDPVTGSAHTLLAPYWGEKLEQNLMRAKQISKRGGLLNLELKGNRVNICGKAITVLSGCLPHIKE
ncbi:MAG: PhzF family phenazine biosynthesis protein [Clostridia bacterium]